MKIVLAALIAFIATPAAALGASLSMREVPLHGERTLASTAPNRFDMVGLHWRGPGSVEFRTRSLGGKWSAWHPAAPEAEDRPDRPVGPWRIGNPYWTGESDRIAYRLRGRVGRLRTYFIESPEVRVPMRRMSMTGSPPIVLRSAWRANESIRRGTPAYASALRFALVHHTAGANSYTASQSAAIVRGIQVYHVQGNGWNDIGYNFLVDKYGQVFEGRYGGMDRNVVGAHAAGFNTGSVGVAVLGTYGSSAPTPAARKALADLLAWRLDIAHVDPLSTLTSTSGGNERFPAGTPVMLRAVSGHRDTGSTSCPGARLYAQLAAIAQQAAATGLPKLFAPTIRGQLGGEIRFQAHLSEVLPWAVTVADADGNVVASATGTSQDIDWVWNAATVPQAAYTWTMSAGETVRPATGTIGTAPVPLAIRSVTAVPKTITPNGDGQTDASTISYTLSTRAVVTATLRAPGGRDLAVLFTQEKPPGKQTFRFAAAGIADGRYEIVLSASDGRTTVTAVVPVLVDRTVRRFLVTPAVSRADVTFSFELLRMSVVRLEIAQNGKTLAQVYSATLQPGPQTVGWNPAGLKDGRYAGVLTVANEIGTVAHTALFRIDTTAPRLRALSFGALRFSVTEPAAITLVVNGKRGTRNVRAGVFSYRHGRVRTVRISARDTAGNVSPTLRFP